MPADKVTENGAPLCLDCKRKMNGSISVASTEHVGLAFICDDCRLKYPNYEAFRDRIAYVSTQDLNEKKGR